MLNDQRVGQCRAWVSPISEPHRTRCETTFFAREALQSAGVLGTLMAALQKHQREGLRDFAIDIAKGP